MRRATTEQSLLCSVDGCQNWWTSDHGRRLCGHHRHQASPARRQMPLLTRDAVRPFAEPVEHDEEYVHDDRA